ncbi:hypothetical protein GCM10009869_07780 [Amnibacterium kyonggiense]
MDPNRGAAVLRPECGGGAELIPGERLERPLRRAAGGRVVHDHDGVVAAGGRQALEPQLERPVPLVQEQVHAVRRGHDLLAGPEQGEEGTRGGELRDEVRQPGVGRGHRRLRAQVGHQAADRLLGTLVEGAETRVEQRGAEEVDAGGERRRQSAGEPVGRDDRQDAVVRHRGGRRQRVEERDEARVGGGAAPGRRRLTGEGAKEVLRGAVEGQRPDEARDDLRRRVPLAALLEPDVVLGADAGEQRDLLAAEARDAAAGAGGDADGLRRHGLPPCAEVGAELTGRHGASVAPGGGREAVRISRCR